MNYMREGGREGKGRRGREGEGEGGREGEGEGGRGRRERGREEGEGGRGRREDRERGREYFMKE